MPRPVDYLTLLLFTLGSQQATASPNRAEVERWWRVSEALMARKPPYEKVEQGVRRKVAEPLLLSTWQNRQELAPGIQRQVGLRLAQAWIGTNDLLRAWDLLQELRTHTEWFACGKPGSMDLIARYSCAELTRLTGTAAYSLHSFPPGRLGSHRIVCSGVDTPRADLRPCLDIAREQFAQSKAALLEIARRIPGNLESQDVRALAELFGVAPAGLDATIKERQSQVQQGMALAWQESSNPETALSELAGTPRTGDARTDSILQLHLARALRDLGQFERARETIRAMPKGTPGTQWAAQLVLATLDIRENEFELAAERLLKAFALREQAQSLELATGSPLDFERRLAAFDNSDDILISGALRFSTSPSWQRLLREYVAFSLGSGDAFVRNQFASWRRVGLERVHGAVAATVASQVSNWLNGELATEQRRRSYEELEKVLAQIKAVPPSQSTGAEIWRLAWRNLSSTNSDLLVILQHRTVDFEKRVAHGVSSLQYTAVYYSGANSAPIIHALGSSSQLDGELRVLIDTIQKGSKCEPMLAKLGAKLQIPPGRAETPKRLVIIPSGELQQFPWALLTGADNRPLIDTRSLVQVGGLSEVMNWTITSRQRGGSVYFGRPDLKSVAARLANGPMHGLLPMLTQGWKESEIKDEAKEIQRLRKLAPVRTFRGAEANETRLLNVSGAAILHIVTHGAYLGGVSAPPGDRSLMLFSADAENDGILLSSEARMMRLDGTRLVVLAACASGRGRPQRSNSVDGFRSAFHLAGADSVLAPIWLVPAEPTSALIQSIYSNSRMPLDQALRGAQLLLRRGNKPNAWAGWVLSGNPF